MKRRAAVNLALALAGTLVGLGLCEGALRIGGFEFPLYPATVEFGFPTPTQLKRMYEPDDLLFWVPQDYDTRVAAGPPVDMVFMGCSCTEFGQYDRLLAEAVETHFPGKSFSYVNVGVGGWSTYQGLQQMQRDVVALHPGIATLYFGWNDHWVGFGADDAHMGRVVSPVVQRFARLRLVQLAAKIIVARTRRQADEWPVRVSPEDFAENLRTMVRVARERGIVPILLTAPSAHRPGEEPAHLAERWIRDLNDLIPLHQTYVERVRTVAAEEDAILCDLAAAFAEISLEERRKELFFPDGIHLTPKGDAIIAGNLLECLREHGLLEKMLKPEASAHHTPGRGFTLELLRRAESPRARAAQGTSPSPDSCAE